LIDIKQENIRVATERAKKENGNFVYGPQRPPIGKNILSAQELTEQFMSESPIS